MQKSYVKINSYLLIIVMSQQTTFSQPYNARQSLMLKSIKAQLSGENSNTIFDHARFKTR